MACATCDNSAGENFGKANLDFATGNFDGMMDCVKVLMYVQQLQGTVDKVLTYTGKLTETSVTTVHTDLMAIEFPNFELCVGTATPVDPVTPVTPAKEPVTPVTPAKEPVTPPASETKRRLQAMKTMLPISQRLLIKLLPISQRLLLKPMPKPILQMLSLFPREKLMSVSRHPKTIGRITSIWIF